MKRFTIPCDASRADGGLVVMTPRYVACTSSTHLLPICHKNSVKAAADHRRYEKDKQSTQKQQGANKSAFPNKRTPGGLIIVSHT